VSIEQVDKLNSIRPSSEHGEYFADEVSFSCDTGCVASDNDDENGFRII